MKFDFQLVFFQTTTHFGIKMLVSMQKPAAAKLTKRVGCAYFYVNLNAIKNKLLNLHLYL